MEARSTHCCRTKRPGGGVSPDPAPPTWAGSKEKASERKRVCSQTNNGLFFFSFVYRAQKVDQVQTPPAGHLVLQGGPSQLEGHTVPTVPTLTTNTQNKQTKTPNGYNKAPLICDLSLTNGSKTFFLLRSHKNAAGHFVFSYLFSLLESVKVIIQTSFLLGNELSKCSFKKSVQSAVHIYNA